MISGWLFDAYPLDNKMVFWIKQEDGSTIRLEDNSWGHSVYIASDCNSYLKSLIVDNTLVDSNDDVVVANDSIASLVKNYEFVSRYESIIDVTKSDVLKLKLADSTKALTLARKIEAIDGNHQFGKYRIYNVDVLPSQSYFYEHDIFPLAFCEVVDNNHCSKLRWLNRDSIWSANYKIPDFKTIHLTVNLRKEGKIERYTDKIDSITIKQHQQKPLNSYNNNSDKTISIECNDSSEYDIIKQLKVEVSHIDPDFVFTEDGDSFTFPYLIHRAEQNCAEEELCLSREPVPLRKPTREGMSYFSYGRVYFRPTAIKLFGIVHIDKSNTFVYNESGLQGLYEIARLCRMPLHTSARASIGKCLSSLQFYYATKKGILIPWKPAIAEHYKTLGDLLVADRGGFIFEPQIGTHEQVSEFDFVSLYPNIMLKKNLSAETILCNCCPNSKLRVPELGYNICEKRIGIVPMSLKIVLDKRKKYKELLKRLTNNGLSYVLKTIYDSRQNALKWILVTSFGYLGFNNAKFGRIDAHIAVCAFDRQILLHAVKIPEKCGYKVLHGIVDSIWIQNKNKHEDVHNKTMDIKNYLKLKDSIERETGFKLTFEGIYKWIVFVHSKANDILPVPNRYFGAFEDGNLKIRGIEARRHDTPVFFSRCQNEILKVMATDGNTINEVKALMSAEINDIFQKYAVVLKEQKVPIEELVLTKRLSKNTSEYQNRNTLESDALRLLKSEGKSLKAGEILKYVITDYYFHNRKTGLSRNNRAMPIELLNDKTSTYDVTRYIELLAKTCNSVTEPFGNTLTTNDVLPLLHPGYSSKFSKS
jgi:DNA polymerase elongation subunit (family B)